MSLQYLYPNNSGESYIYDGYLFDHNNNLIAYGSTIPNSLIYSGWQNIDEGFPANDFDYIRYSGLPDIIESFCVLSYIYNNNFQEVQDFSTRIRYRGNDSVTARVVIYSWDGVNPLPDLITRKDVALEQTNDFTTYESSGGSFYSVPNNDYLIVNYFFINRNSGEEFSRVFDISAAEVYVSGQYDFSFNNPGLIIHGKDSFNEQCPTVESYFTINSKPYQIAARPSQAYIDLNLIDSEYWWDLVDDNGDGIRVRTTPKTIEISSSGIIHYEGSGYNVNIYRGNDQSFVIQCCDETYSPVSMDVAIATSNTQFGTQKEAINALLESTMSSLSYDISNIAATNSCSSCEIDSFEYLRTDENGNSIKTNFNLFGACFAGSETMSFCGLNYGGYAYLNFEIDFIKPSYYDMSLLLSQVNLAALPVGTSESLSGMINDIYTAITDLPSYITLTENASNTSASLRFHDGSTSSYFGVSYQPGGYISFSLNASAPGNGWWGVQASYSGFNSSTTWKPLIAWNKVEEFSYHTDGTSYYERSFGDNVFPSGFSLYDLGGQQKINTYQKIVSDSHSLRLEGNWMPFDWDVEIEQNKSNCEFINIDPWCCIVTMTDPIVYLQATNQIMDILNIDFSKLETINSILINHSFQLQNLLSEIENEIICTDGNITLALDSDLDDIQVKTTLYWFLACSSYFHVEISVGAGSTSFYIYDAISTNGNSDGSISTPAQDLSSSFEYFVDLGLVKDCDIDPTLPETEFIEQKDHYLPVILDSFDKEEKTGWLLVEIGDKAYIEHGIELKIYPNSEAVSPGNVFDYVDSPISFYDFSSTANLTDLTGNNHGVISGHIVSVSGKIGKAWQLNGNGYADLGDTNSLEGLSEFTISTWAYLQDYPASGGIIAIKQGEDSIWELGISNSGNILFGISTDATKELLIGSPLPKNTWSKITGTWDGLAMRLYLNDSINASVAKLGTMDSNSYSSFISNNYLGWSGNLDILSIYDSALSLAKISTHYNNENSATGIWEPGSFFGLIPSSPDIIYYSLKTNTSKIHQNIPQVCLNLSLINAQEWWDNTDGNLKIEYNNSGISYIIDYLDIPNKSGLIWIDSSFISSSVEREIKIYPTGGTEGNIFSDSKSPVAFYNFAQNPATYLKDITGNNYSGIVYGGMTSANLVNGKVGKAWNLDGTNDYIVSNVGSKLKAVGTGDYMYFGWAYIDLFDPVTSRDDIVIWKDSSGSQDQGIYVQAPSDSYRPVAYGPPVGDPSRSDNAQLENEWFFVGYIRRGQYKYVIHNGTLYGEFYNDYDLSYYLDDQIWLGSNHSNFSPFTQYNHDGKLSAWRFYDTSLTNNQILTIYESENTTSGIWIASGLVQEEGIEVPEEDCYQLGFYISGNKSKYDKIDLYLHNQQNVYSDYLDLRLIGHHGNNNGFDLYISGGNVGQDLADLNLFVKVKDLIIHNNNARLYLEGYNSGNSNGFIPLHMPLPKENGSVNLFIQPTIPSEYESGIDLWLNNPASGLFGSPDLAMNLYLGLRPLTYSGSIFTLPTLTITGSEGLEYKGDLFPLLISGQYKNISDQNPYLNLFMNTYVPPNSGNYDDIFNIYLQTLDPTLYHSSINLLINSDFEYSSGIPILTYYNPTYSGDNGLNLFINNQDIGYNPDNVNLFLTSYLEESGNLPFWITGGGSAGINIFLKGQEGVEENSNIPIWINSTEENGLFGYADFYISGDAKNLSNINLWIEGTPETYDKTSYLNMFIKNNNLDGSISTVGGCDFILFNEYQSGFNSAQLYLEGSNYVNAEGKMNLYIGRDSEGTTDIIPLYMLGPNGDFSSTPMYLAGLPNYRDSIELHISGMVVSGDFLRMYINGY